ncbi:protoporphyrinogen oxidase [Radiobacillus kanasensis]|uniref:protoporphyrinogen oxidase n=1 Tax=Radiobacillus kanasensis TaxID=2844358 RepID=UPI001E286B14|nr:protoporphyrinogen oxidase [Radiobacillus kanasensis]UFU00509.1 protoporphyrinogen oxidase [Radiobacillus kanasensis]
MSHKKQIVVIGGGITGLTAAYYLQKEIDTNQLPYEVKLIEASDRLGGKIKSLKRDGFTIERGPDSFLIRKKSAAELAKDVGLEDKLIKNGTGQSYILVNDHLHKMPSGSFMGVPTQVKPFLSSSLFSWRGKIRAGLDFVLPKGKEQSDQSLGLFFRRRLGDEIVENVIEPLLSGIYAGDIDDLSLMSTFPNFYELEQEHQSLVKGLQKTTPKPQKPQPNAKKPSMFYSLENGLESLIHAIESKLPEGTVLKSTQVDEVNLHDSQYALVLKNQKTIQADAVVMATPYFATAKMLGSYPFVEPLNQMKATSVANVALAFDASAIEKDIDGTGFVVSRNSSYRITACTWVHKKWPNSTPKGKVLLRCFVGKPDDQEVVDLLDEEIIDIALKDLKRIMNITAEPNFSVVTRWKQAMPQYSVGHKLRLESVREGIKRELPGLFLAGSSYDGIGIPDCIDQGKVAVEQVLAFLKE